MRILNIKRYGRTGLNFTGYVGNDWVRVVFVNTIPTDHDIFINKGKLICNDNELVFYVSEYTIIK